MAFSRSENKKVLWTFIALEGRRLGVRHLWAPAVASLVVGVSLGLPLFLYLRQAQLERLAVGNAKGKS